jgi:signal transduction histidine kinase
MVFFLAANAGKSLRRQEKLQEDLIRSDRLAAMGTLVAGMTHEFNNINLTVLGFSQLLLERDDLPAEAEDHLKRINRAAGRARTITNNLLDFSRNGGGSYRRSNIAVAAAEALSLIREPYEKEGIVIRELVDPVPDSYMDHDQIVQVLLNIVTNSRHAMLDQDRRVLTLKTGSAGLMVYASVSDTGRGIPEEELSEVFTPFYSTKGEYAGDAVQAKIRGTGWG